MKKSAFLLLIVFGLLLSCSKDEEESNFPTILAGTTFVCNDGPLVVVGTISWMFEFKENGKYSLSSSEKGKYGFTTRRTGTYTLKADWSNDVIFSPDQEPEGMYILEFDGTDSSIIHGPNYNKFYYTIEDTLYMFRKL